MEPHQIIEKLSEIDFRIGRLNEEKFEFIERLNKLQAQCSHKWTVKYEPEKIPRYVFTGWEGTGSDPTPRQELVGYDNKPKWTRKCSKCQKVETTNKVVTKVEPEF